MMIEFLAYNLVGLMFLLMVVAPLVNHAAGGPMPGSCLMTATIGTSHGRDEWRGFVRRDPAGPVPRRPTMPKPEPAATGGPAKTVLGPDVDGLDIDGPDIDGLDIDGVEGRMQAASVRRMAAIVDSRPREAAAVLKSWLGDRPS
jgi:hypothetical protein